MGLYVLTESSLFETARHTSLVWENFLYSVYSWRPTDVDSISSSLLPIVSILPSHEDAQKLFDGRLTFQDSIARYIIQTLLAAQAKTQLLLWNTNDWRMKLKNIRTNRMLPNQLVPRIPVGDSSIKCTLTSDYRTIPDPIKEALIEIGINPPSFIIIKQDTYTSPGLVLSVRPEEDFIVEYFDRTMRPLLATVFPSETQLTNGAKFTLSREKYRELSRNFII